MKKLLLSFAAAVIMALGMGVSIAKPVEAADTTKCTMDDGTEAKVSGKDVDCSTVKAFKCPDGSTKYETSYTTACEKNGITTNGATNKDLLTTGNTIVRLVIGLIGFVAVVMIVIGGISFATSQGDTAKTTKAKNTVLYGVIGLVVALLAYAIVSFVLTGINK